MARKARVNPRKEASQTRSRATVDALVEATARVLVREGVDKASTNRIAEVAGVSIGSLYQYFPSKEALVAAVVERHSREIMQTVRAAVPDLMAVPLAQGVRILIAAAVKAHRVHPKLHHVLSEQIPRAGMLKKVETFSRENVTLFRDYLEHRRDEIRVADLDLASFICVTTIEALTHSAVLHNAKPLSDDAMEVLVDEATRLVTGYLAGV